MITGGCLCGAVRYEAERKPLFAVLCHCRDCQRASGSGHVPVMGVPKSSFKVSGQTNSYALPGGSGLKSIRHFCPTCGSLLFGTPEAAPDAVSIYVGSLDDLSVFQPEAVIFKRSRQSWDQTLGSLPEFDALPAAPPPMGAKD
ncbi:MAG: GFA family protein [Candidatus Binataceae bacterium]